MESKASLVKWTAKNRDPLLAAGWALAIALVLALCCDFHYELNDDDLIKDITSGAYTGSPEAHNIQMLYPAGALLSLPYRLLPAVPWYGLFYGVCLFGCLYLLAARSLSFCRTWSARAGLLALLTGLTAGLFLPHLVFFHYTIVCALLASTAAFLFYTTDSALPVRKFLVKNIPSVLLVWLAYLIRSEMLLLLLPLICVAGALKWAEERPVITRENGLKYLTVILAVLAGIGVGQAAHRLAGSPEEWREFDRLFDNRTELYDFQKIPDYEGNEEFYASLGLTEAEQELLHNYNYGLSPKIDAELLGKTADYAAGLRKQERSLLSDCREGARAYLRHTFTAEDYPWNLLTLLLYAAVLAAGQLRAEKRINEAGKLLLLGAVRTSLWMFILVRGRDPERILHSLYLMELCILSAMLLNGWNGTGRKMAQRILTLLIAAGVFAAVPSGISRTAAGYRAATEGNKPYLAMREYCREQENNFYFLDVYSWVDYTDPVFRDADSRFLNYDIMGGWACRSPLQSKKLASRGITDMQTALIAMENVYYMAEPEADNAWLVDYYRDQGKTVRLQQVDRLGDAFCVYRLTAE